MDPNTEQNSVASGKIIIIPFTHPSGEHASSVAAISEAADGGDIRETIFYTTGKMAPCDGCFETGIATEPGKSLTQGGDLVVRHRAALPAHPRCGLPVDLQLDHLELKIEPGLDLAPMVRSAYERASYYRPSPPPVLPLQDPLVLQHLRPQRVLIRYVVSAGLARGSHPDIR